MLCSSALFLIIANSFGTSNILSPGKLKASEVYIPIGKTGKKISLLELSTISMSGLQTLTERKMNFTERISFRIAQKKLRKNIAADGTIEKKKLEKFFLKRSGETGFHVGGFALGFFLGLIGVLIAYLINDDYKRNRVKWAWIG
ncbi:MAG TPA: hypothetical protein VGQ09_11140 [Chitinophagaceae bacterium]|nr:hypothetical protein [Chitinophagaceae bacterium]